MIEVVPEAKSIRSHSMTQSSNLLDLFQRKGITHDCNHFIPEQYVACLKPWYLWNSMIKVPYFWEDDVMCIHSKSTPVKELALRPGLKCFDFHPIHVFLNTESLDRYERTRPLHQNPKELIKHRYQCYGTRDRLVELLELSNTL